VAVAVDGTWLHRVWAAGAAVVDGHLVLAIDGDPTGPGRATAQVVDWSDERPHRPSTVTRAVAYREDRWTLGPDADGSAPGEGAPETRAAD
jgi:hypothetical protein